MRTLADMSTLGLCPYCLMSVAVSELNVFDHPTLTQGTSRGPRPEIERLNEQVPQFEFQELLGGGGAGWVFRARQISLDRMVAIKVLPGIAADRLGAGDRFEREAQILARLNDPRIVTVFDYGMVDDGRYLAMEYVPGPTLRELLQTSRPDVKTCFQIIDQICAAVEHAHGKGVLHCDLKPENVLFESENADGDLKVADFGISRLMEDAAESATRTYSGMIMGTPFYAAPEQLTVGWAPDRRADIFSLGVILYELLTGKLPAGRFAPPSQHCRVSEAVDRVVLRCLENSPLRRFSDVSSLRQALQAAKSKRPLKRGTKWGIAIAATTVVVSSVLAWKLSDRPSVLPKPEVKEVAKTEPAPPKKTLPPELPAKAPPTQEDVIPVASSVEPLKEYIEISHVSVRGADPKPMRLKADCKILDKGALANGGPLVWVVEFSDGKRMAVPVFMSKHQRAATLNESFFTHLAGKWPLTTYIEEERSEPARDAVRVSNAIKLQWWDVQPQLGLEP